MDNRRSAAAFGVTMEDRDVYVVVDGSGDDVELQRAAARLYSEYCGTKLVLQSQVESILHILGQNWHFGS